MKNANERGEEAKVEAGEEASADDDVIRFDSFRLIPARRLLLDGQAAVHVGNRALDILLLLIQRAGEFVSNDEIVARVWPRSVVVEGNLRVHIAALRKALGDGREGRRYIVNVPNRGYRFTAQVNTEVARQVPGAGETPALSRTTLPVPMHRIIGRQAETQSLAEQVQRHRLVTVVGAGGIGKTTVAVSVVSSFAQRLSKTPWTSVHFVDLGPLDDPRLVPNALAAALGLTVASESVVPNLIAFLHDKAALLLVDTCEHVIAAVVDVIEAILQGAPRVHVLATSREPLRAEGEWIQRLQALALPGAAPHRTLEEATSFGAVELFVERAAATLNHVEFSEADIPYAVEICQRLDGIPLAIELAAARVESLGYRGVASALDDSFALLRKGRRTALPRQQTLESTLDWSFRLLSERDQHVLGSLSVFARSFTLEAACEVVAQGALATVDVLDSLADLVAKSLVTADVTGEDSRFRLLDTTRSYAVKRLVRQSDAAALSRRHAVHCISFLEKGEREWTDTPTRQWMRRYGSYVDDVRAALRWAFSAQGDVRLGIELTAKAAPMLFQMSLANEERIYAKQALDAIASLPDVEPRLEFELNILYGHVLFHTLGLRPESDQAFAKALEIALATGDRQRLALAYSTNWMGAYTLGEPTLMREFSAKFRALTADATEPAIQLLYDRMQAPTLHFSGDQKGARISAERSLATRTLVRSPFLSGAQIDRRVSMGCILVRTLWVLGLPVQANRMAVETIDVAVSEGESIALAFILGFAAIPLALASGWHDVARARIDLALRHTAEHSLVSWRNYALAFEPLLHWYERGSVGAPVLTEPIGIARRPPQLGELLATLHPSYADEATLQRGENGKAGWCEAELLRIRGERTLGGDPAQAEAYLQRSLDLAMGAEALTWELRSSVSLARLWARTGRPDLAYERLGTVLARVQEGFSTPDVRAAVALYHSLARTTGKYAKRFPDVDDAETGAVPPPGPRAPAMGQGD